MSLLAVMSSDTAVPTLKPHLPYPNHQPWDDTRVANLFHTMIHLKIHDPNVSECGHHICKQIDKYVGKRHLYLYALQVNVPVMQDHQELYNYKSFSIIL
ncbi:hypothetical protein MT418_8439 [Batrachochytrium dendrobatidis]